MSDNDPVARAKAIAARLASVVEGGGGGEAWDSGNGNDAVLGKRRDGYGELNDKKRAKITVPEDMERDLNISGILIGPKGSNLQAMQERTGARVLLRGKGSTKGQNPNDPEAMEPLHVVIEGSEDAVAAASAEVNKLLGDPNEALKLKSEQLEKLAEFKKGDTGGGGRVDEGGHYGPVGGGGDVGSNPGLGLVHEVTFEVPNQVVGSIIGRGGETIQKIQAQYGINVQVAKAVDVAAGASTRPVTLKGPQEMVELAKGDIELLVQDRLSVAEQLATGQGGGVGGGGGGGIMNVGQSTYGPGNTAGGGATSTLLPQPGSVLITRIVPNDKIGLIIGKGGGTIKGMQMRTGANIQIPSQPDADNPAVRTISISANNQEACDRAATEIQSVLEAGPNGTGTITGGTTLYIQIPNDRVGLIIGKGGSTIKDIQNRTGARIQIPQHPDPGTMPPMRTVSLTGIGNAPIQAKYEIEYMCANDIYGVGGGTTTGAYGAGAYGGTGLVDPYMQQGYAGYGAIDPYSVAPYGQGFYQQPGLSDPYTQQFQQQQQAQQQQQQAHQQQQAQMPQQQATQQQAGKQDQPATQATGASVTQTAAATNQPASTGTGVADGSQVDMTQYYDQFWQYAKAYGEKVAREQYGLWAPPVGTPPPAGIVLGQVCCDTRGRLLMSSPLGKYNRLGEQAWAKQRHLNAELFTLTYGAMVMQLIEDFEDVLAVNKQLELMGYNIGLRLIDEFLAKSGVPGCCGFPEAAEVTARVGFKMFLGISAEASKWNSDETACSIIIPENPLIDYVELPPQYSELLYSNVLCGVIRGALEMVQMRVECHMVKDVLKGDETNEIRIELKGVLADDMAKEYQEE